MSETFRIGERVIGPGQPAYIVAEMSANHHGRLDEALRLIEAAKAAGADAVKLQTYTADTMTIACDRPEFQIRGGTLWDGRTLYDLYREAHTPWNWYPKLQAAADQLSLTLFSTAFDDTAVAFLERMRVPVHKVASFELVDLPLIQLMARTGKPLIISTGMGSLQEIQQAVDAARQAGATQILLLKCTSAYPAPPDEMHLRTIPHLAAQFNVPVGLSDHTLGHVVPAAAVTLGACMIEKHLTLARAAGGPDAAFSLEPQEFQEMVSAIRTAERALGTVAYGGGAEEARNRTFRRSLFITKALKAGEVIGPAHVRAIRPAHGLAPKHLRDVIGRKATKDIDAGTPLSWALIDRQA